MAQGGSSVADLEKQLAELQAKQKEYQQNYRNVIKPRSEYETNDYNYAVLQFRRKYGPDNYLDRIRAAQQQLDAARKAATTPPPADNPPADNPPADKPPGDGYIPPPSDFNMITTDTGKKASYQQNYQSAPMYGQFKQSDYYKNMPKISAAVIGNATIDGKNYNFSTASEAEAYVNYMKSLGNYQVGVPSESIMTTQDTTLAGKTGEELEKALVQKQAERVDDASLPSEQTITPTKITEKAGEIVSPDDFKTPEAPQVESAKPLDVSDYTQQTPEAFAAPTVTAAKLDDITPVDAATLDAPSAQAIIKAAQGKPSPESLAIAATEELDPRATVKYQLAELYKSLEDGQPLPAWASPAVRKATALMKQRGLGASSMAAAATIQALAESGIAIASADADKYARIQLQNLSNQQQAVLQNATVFAQMDLQNLNNRQTAAVNNAKTFLTLDVQNLTNEQQAATLNYQGQVQALLQDSKQENAARQFNAKNQTQVETFFADLGVQIESATLNRKAAIEQYNMSQTNAISQFNSQMKAARDQFNSSMTAQIAQSNAQWRRDVNTVNTATQNAANQQNAMNLLGLSQQSMANLWQLYRDQAAWTMSTSENNLQRAHNAAMQSMVISANSSQYDDEFEDFLIIRTIDNIWGD